MNHTYSILMGIAIWAFVFVISMLAFPIRAEERALFESIMPVALTLATTVGAVSYFRLVTRRFIATGVWFGIIVFLTNLGIDALIFSWGPMKMPRADYIKDIGFTYIIMFIIPIGIGYLLEERKKIQSA